MERIVFFLILATITDIGEAYKFLIISAHLKSHIGCFSALGEELAARGHEQHFLFNKYFDVSKSVLSIKNSTVVGYIPPDDMKIDFDELYRLVTKVAMEKDPGDPGFYKEFIAKITLETEVVLSHNDDFLASLEAENYDYAIIDTFFMNKYYHVIAHRLGIPVISFVDVIEPLKMRVPWLPSYVPFFIVPFSDKMTFVERIKNFASYLTWEFIDPTPRLPHSLKDKYQKYGVFKDLHELEAKTKFWLITHDHVLDYPRPILDNMVNVGGLATKPPKPLPENLQQFAVGAQDGIIVVTFGSMAADMPGEIISRFMEAFRNFNGKLRVIWRLKNRAQIPVPPNVMLSDWLPQNDLLGYKKTKIFITHCGKNGAFETVYNGVPVIGFPLFGDQFTNANIFEYKHYGIKMNIKTFKSEELVKNINTLVYDDLSYSASVKRAGEEFRDRPETPAQRAAFWVEHVTRHGVAGMRSHAADMPLYQYIMIDIVGALLLALCFVILVIFLIARFLIRCLFCRRSASRKSKAE